MNDDRVSNNIHGHHEVVQLVKDFIEAHPNTSKINQNEKAFMIVFHYTASIHFNFD